MPVCSVENGDHVGRANSLQRMSCLEARGSRLVPKHEVVAEAGLGEEVARGRAPYRIRRRCTDEIQGPLLASKFDRVERDFRAMLGYELGGVNPLIPLVPHTWVLRQGRYPARLGQG